MSNHSEHTNLIWQIADLLRGPYRPPQYERVMRPPTAPRRFDLAPAIYYEPLKLAEDVRNCYFRVHLAKPCSPAKKAT